MNFLKNPYIPQKRVSVAVSGRNFEGVLVIPPYKSEKLPYELSLHADLTFCHLGDGVCVCEPDSFEYYKKAFSDIPIRLIKGEKPLDKHYPEDSSYNVAIVGKHLFCKKDITDKVLLETAEEMGYKVVNINQGYAKCSVCPVDEKSAISADKSFFKAAEKEGIETLLITNRTIRLPGYDNGFFGGAAFMLGEKTFCCAGSITSHPDYEKIYEFLKKRNIKIKCDKNGNLLDFGSFIPITEE